ncbi:DNA topoisomerase IB [Tranquillimonas alkanivorans]|uniref:DNA topoisomerase n=1 Tax=Tranquillimonas alkanivorans TaxID=441119 RepID=A0A1I5U4J7_9RHOB|nr:DNA topoisomerase IB [Tranquillimonas alkanivorans]SFP90181.1 DNA topoisomerase-1 [Tranquillimonas alkanivorans]
MREIPDLIYYPDTRPGITRRRCGRGFTYFAPDGTRIEDVEERRRLSSLAVPPAYENVWICPRPDGHLQASGRDARQRKQYRYHPKWTEYRARKKYDDLTEFGRALPRIRRNIARDLDREAGDIDFAVAAVLAIIDRLSLRIGHPDYEHENGTYGATTLTHRHLSLGEHGLDLRYPGKGGRDVKRHVKDNKLQKVLHDLDDLPGARLVEWIDSDGTPREVTSDLVNHRLAEITQSDRLTAKTFRTWNGSVAALHAAAEAEKVTIKGMSEAAAQRLANTPTIARNSYIHPEVIALAEDPGRIPQDPPQISGLRVDERRLMALIDR